MDQRGAADDSLSLHTVYVTGFLRTLCRLFIRSTLSGSTPGYNARSFVYIHINVSRSPSDLCDYF